MAAPAMAGPPEKLSFGSGKPVPMGDAVKGQHVFDAVCWVCHGHALNGGTAPPLTGADFFKVWQGRKAEALSDLIRNTMPRDNPGILSEPMARDIVAYIVSYANKPAKAGE